MISVLGVAPIGCSTKKPEVPTGPSAAVLFDASKQLPASEPALCN